MTDTSSDCMVPGACTVPSIDVWVLWSGTAGGVNEYIVQGELVPIGNSSIIAAGPVSATQVGTVTQRRMAQFGVAMSTVRTGNRVRVRIQGNCMAFVKNIANVAISANDELYTSPVYTVSGSQVIRQLEASRPNVNTNRSIARCVGTVASGSSAVPSLIEVVMLGVYGHGLGGQGA